MLLIPLIVLEFAASLCKGYNNKLVRVEWVQMNKEKSKPKKFIAVIGSYMIYFLRMQKTKYKVIDILFDY